MRSVIAILLVFCLNQCFSQTLPANLDAIRLVEKADYKAAEATVTQTANYLLSIPRATDTVDIMAVYFVMQWIKGTPDYFFPIDPDVANMINGDPVLLFYYMICMAKYATEKPQNVKDLKAWKLNSLKLLLSYCEDEKNNMKMTKQLKKLSEANKKGKIEKGL